MQSQEAKPEIDEDQNNTDTKDSENQQKPASNMPINVVYCPRKMK